MRPSLETLQMWVDNYKKAPRVRINMKTQQIPMPSESFDLLDHLEYTPSERDQGYCGNCWAWAGTGVTEVALDVQNGVKDRLSIQYLNSNYYGGSGPNWACCGGDLTNFVYFYNTEEQTIPWSNTNAHWQDGSQLCEAESTNVPADSISTIPNYNIASITNQTIPTHNDLDESVETQAEAIANIKSVLDQNKAISFSFYLATDTDWNSFFSFWDTQPESTILNPDPYCGKVATGLGGHAVLCVGYNDEEGTSNDYWIMVNSWGTTTGRPNGIFYLDMNMDYNCTFRLPPLTFYSFYWETLDMTYNVWDSYKGNYFDSGGTRNDYFDDPDSENTVYMYGTGFTAGNYRIVLWDADGDKRVNEVTSPTDGVLKISHTFNPESDTAGGWHATVYNSTYDPETYSADDMNIVVDDISYNGVFAFHATESAIPEFPTVLAAVAALTLCTGVYFWMRRKVAKAQA